MSNQFKEMLRHGNPQFGIFCVLTSDEVADLISDAGFQFVVFEAEHSPTSLPTLRAQLLALGRSNTAAVVRTSSAAPSVLKPILDLGVDTLMIPNIKSAHEAKLAVEATRFPPLGSRGIGGSVRATRFGRNNGYYASAAEDTCVLLQIESQVGLVELEQICAVDGVDGIFFGPADLAADMGLLGQPTHQEVVSAITDGIQRAKRVGTPVGVLASEERMQFFLDAGASFGCFGSDMGLLAVAVDGLGFRWCRRSQRGATRTQ